MKVFELMSALSECEAGREVKLSVEFDKPIVEQNGNGKSVAVGSLTDIQDGSDDSLYPIVILRS